MRTIKYLFLVSLLLSNQLIASQLVDLTLLFPNVAQGHDAEACFNNPNAQNPNPKAQFHINGGDINGTGGKALDFCSIYDETGGNTLNCDNAEGISKSSVCNITGNRVNALDLEDNFKFKTSTSTISDINSCNSGDSVTVGEGAYDVDQLPNLSFDSNCTLTFSSNHSEYRIKSLSLGNGAAAIFAPGDYYIEDLYLRYNSKVYIQGDTRLFVKNHLTVAGATDINSSNEHTLRIILYNSLKMEYGSLLGGLIYVQGDALIEGGTLNGRITAGTLKANQATINSIPLDEYIDEVDTYKGPFQFGKTDALLGGEVTFPQPFDQVPKVFLMPTIAPPLKVLDTTFYWDNPDGSATATIIEVTKTGFRWQVERPIYNTVNGGGGCILNDNCDNPAQPMEIHWIAATEGKHTLSDGKEIVVGSVRFKDKPALGMQKIVDLNGFNGVVNTNKEPLSWVKVEPSQISKESSVVLNSRQAKVNDCFLTSVALPIDQKSGVGTRSGTYFMLDTSNATVSGRDMTSNDFLVGHTSTTPLEKTNCLPPLPKGLTDSGIATLADEEIAYLATKPGVGEFTDADGSTVRYEFGSANTNATQTDINLNVGQMSMYYYCNDDNYLTKFSTTFDDIPTFIGSKVSVNNNNTQNYGAGVWLYRNDYVGGFLRRCRLTKSAVSMVNDEVNTFYWTPRWAFPERYAFVALEKVEPPQAPVCFTDEFDRTKVGDDWVTYIASESTIGIVDGKLRLTEAKKNQATAATYQRFFPIVNNIIEIEFDYYSYYKEGTNFSLDSNLRRSGDGIALVFSDSSITPKVGAPGAGLGYTSKDSTPGFAGGWLAFGLDDFGNFAGDKNKIRATGANPDFKHLGTSNNLSNNALTVTNPWNSANPPKFGDRYRFVIDSSTDPNKINISVSRRKQGETGAFTPINLDNKAIIDIKGTNTSITNDLLLSLTSSTGSAFATHEIDNFKVCALRSTSMGQLIHHFRFEYSDTPSTCAAEAVKITACRNADCSLVVDEEVVTATLKPTNSDSVTWSGTGVRGNTVTFSGGSTTIYFNNTAAGDITFGVTASSPGLQAFTSYDGTALCKQGASNFSSAACTVTFKNTALVLESFDVETAEREGNINGMIANKPRDVVISAYKEKDTEGSDTSEVCEAAPLGTKNIHFWSEYDNPNSSDIIGSPQINVTNNTVTAKSYTIGNSEKKKTSIPIVFDDQGKATIKINYPDSGKVQLKLELVDTDDKGNSTSYEGSGQFVSFPAGLCLTALDENSACESNDATCSAFKAAGEVFNLQVQAKAWRKDNDDFCDNPIVTPNYQQDKIELSHVLVNPDPGEIGELSTHEYSHILGDATNIPLSISEVGVFTLQAKPPLPYLGSRYHEIGASSASIGRFYPHRFSSEGASISHQCSDFSYMGQAFTSNAFIKALNVNGEVTQNYQGSFAKSSLKLTAENNNDGVDLSDRIAFSINERVKSSSWTKGQLQLGHSTIFERHKGTAPDGNYSNLAIGLQIIEPNILLDNPQLNPNTAGDCRDSESCTALLLGDNNDLRYGRVKLENTYGSGREVLQMPAYTEYWNVNKWKINDKDSCTEASHYSYEMIETDERGVSVTIKRYRRDDEDIFNNGKQILYWKASSPYYRRTIPAKLAVPEYLQWYWDGLTLSDPEATVTFGRYRGHNKITYRGEAIN